MAAPSRVAMEKLTRTVEQSDRLYSRVLMADDREFTPDDRLEIVDLLNELALQLKQQQLDIISLYQQLLTEDPK